MNYVLDLLSESEAAVLVEEARRILRPGGLLGLVSLTRGRTRLSRLVCRTWDAVHDLNPTVVGGCRPVSLPDFLVQDRWSVIHQATVEPFGVASAVLVASPRVPEAPSAQ